MLKHRLITASIMILLLGSAVFWASPYAGLIFTTLGVLMALVALHEYFQLTARLDLPGFPRMTMAFGGVLVAGLGLIGFRHSLDLAKQQESLLASIVSRMPVVGEELQGRLALDYQMNLFGAGVMLLFLFCCFIQVSRAKDFRLGIRNLLASLAGFFYLCWTLSFLIKTYYFQATIGEHSRLGPFLVFFVIMVTKFGDVGGYTFGKLTAMRKNGNHKMVPRLSPGKSWEGFVGSLIFSVLVALGLLTWYHSRYGGGTAPMQMVAKSVLGADRIILNVPLAIGIGLVLAAVGLIGDLAESILKRAADVKDSGKALPGMGGALDALDSLIFIAPAFYVYLTFLAR